MFRHTPNGDCRTRALIRVFGLAALLSAPFAPGQVNRWTPIGPDGGNILAVVVDPAESSVVFATALNAGAFRSNDAGGSWTQVLLPTVAGGWGQCRAATFAVGSNPPRLFAGCAYLMTSADAGDTWTTTDLFFPRSVVVSSSDPTRVYVNSFGSLYRSANGGVSFLYVGGIGSDAVLVVDPADSETLYVARPNEQLRRSNNSGGFWTDLAISNLSAFAVGDQGASLYAGRLGLGVAKSVDGGAHWDPANEGLADLDVVALAAKTTGAVWAVTKGHGIFWSVDGGTHWNASSGLPDDVRVVAVDPSDSARLYAGSLSRGVFRSSDGGKEWSARSTGLQATPVERLATHPLSPGALFAGLNDGTLGIRSGPGAPWTLRPRAPVQFLTEMSMDPSDPNTLYASGGGLFKTGNGGETWSDVTPAEALGVSHFAVSPSNPDVLYAAGAAVAPSGLHYDTIFKTLDAGAHWDEAGSGLPPPPLSDEEPSFALGRISVDPADSSVAYVGGNHGGLEFDVDVFKTADGGALWEGTDIDAGLLSGYADVVVAGSGDPRTVFAGGGGNRILRSTDGAKTWDSSNTIANPNGPNSISVSEIAVDSADPYVVYATSGFGSVLKSVDGGRNFDEIGGDLAGIRQITSLAIDTDDGLHLFIGVEGGGVFEMHQDPPTAASLSPVTATANATVTITGSKFASGAAVRFGDAAAEDVVVVDDETITATAPDLPPGRQDVTVVNPNGLAGILRGGWFTDYADAPASFFFHDAIVKVSRAGISTGCGAGKFCPEAVITRDAMAILILRAAHGSAFKPPPALGTIFDDVGADAFGAAWIERVAAEGIAHGCGLVYYCPRRSLSRGEAAVFLVRALRGSSFQPPPATGTFDDVLANSLFARWIEEAAREGIAAGCGAKTYCPDRDVTRGELAAFLARAFRLP